jgi:hypothetical protein
VKSGCGYRFAWAALVCASCIPPPLVAADGAAGTGGPTGGQSGSGGIGGTGGTGGPLTIQIDSDKNDALWINSTDERLHYSASNPTIEVGSDGEMGRVGLRFGLSLPAGSTITSATLSLLQHSGEFTVPSTMTVQVYDSVDVPAFDDTHDHLPQDHDGNHLWGMTVTGFMVRENGDTCTSPNIAALVQRIVDKQEWTGTGWIGFVLSPDQDKFAAPGWVAFYDSFSGGDGASLVLAYAPH